MKIILYAQTSENIKVDKALSVSYTMEGTLKDETNIMTPSITIQSKGIPNVNYLYIEAFNRYYYIESIDVIHNNIFRINAKVDVLMSFKDGIRKTKAIINKSENEERINRNLIDGTYTTTPEVFTEVIKFETPFSTSNSGILLTCV